MRWLPIEHLLHETFLPFHFPQHYARSGRRPEEACLSGRGKVRVAEPVGNGQEGAVLPSPDFFRLVPWDGKGLRPVGYGFDSIEAIVGTARRVEAAAEGLSTAEGLDARRRILQEVDSIGLIATPANSSINELVVEAARMSILKDGLPVSIAYEGESAWVKPRGAWGTPSGVFPS